MNLASTLKELRHESGLSMRELARASGIQKSTISNLESGKLTNPCVDTIEKLADTMGYHFQLVFTPKLSSHSKGLKP